MPSRRTRRPEADLSQALAEGGVLPMFGFPTRVRYLYHDRPTGRSLPPPGSHRPRPRDRGQPVRSRCRNTEGQGRAHRGRGWGVGALRRASGTTTRIRSGRQEDLLVLPRLLAHRAHSGPAHACPVCGEAAPRFGPITFRSRRASSQIGARATTTASSSGHLPRRAAGSSRLASRVQRWSRTSRLASAQTFCYVLNDNDGDGFRLAPAVNPNINGWFSVDLKEAKSRPVPDPELQD